MRGAAYPAVTEVKEMLELVSSAEKESLADKVSYVLSPAVLRPALLMWLLFVLQVRGKKVTKK